MFSMYSELLFLPQEILTLILSPPLWGMLIVGVVMGYVIGVLPGLGPTMGMALMLGIVFRVPVDLGLALLIGILVSSMGAGGITASMINIPGTAAAAATCMDGYAMTKKGMGREAVGLVIFASAIGTVLGIILILLIQPFIFSIALKFGDWEVFLFCLFGIMICGSLSSDQPIKGWIAGILGLFFAMVGIDEVQSVPRFTFGSQSLLQGIDVVAALLGLFGVSEVFFVLKDKQSYAISAGSGWPTAPFKTIKKNISNIIRSLLAGMWVGFIPGVGESTACWFSYDLAKRSSKERGMFGKGSAEGILAAEVADNSSSVGALIPALSLGIPGSATTAIFLAAMFLMGFRPGPTLLLDSPGILCKISVLFLMAAFMTVALSYLFSPFTIKFLSIPNEYLMPLIAGFCVLGAWGSGFLVFTVVIMLIFGIIGFVMKLRNYPVAPMVLGLLIGNILDVHFRRAFIQYSTEPLGLLMRPFGLAVIVILIVLFILGLKTERR